MALQEALLELEMDTAEVTAGLVTEFDRCYSEMAEANKLQYNAYFTQVTLQERVMLRNAAASSPAQVHATSTVVVGGWQDSCSSSNNHAHAH